MNEAKPHRFSAPEFYRIIFFKDEVRLLGEQSVPSGMIQMVLSNNKLLLKVVIRRKGPTTFHLRSGKL
ncbi:hypothetical protein J2X69_004063 [Algoriphagus sp. 4150]|nr:hypothetical protein [Algoriphagus sp. 4150]